MMTSEQRTYRSYLLRLWQAGNGDAPQWRILLEDVRTRERQSFASVAQLATFLHTHTGETTHDSGSPTGHQPAADETT
jgi:hypothetical protein